ncbi:MAG: sigma-E factor negative regulatory protein [Burkholderiales bacterium]|nr:sigma-E factor negative regulatory protein [Burkholderiales bacterium]
MTAPSPSPTDREPVPPAAGPREPRQWLSALADGEREALPHAAALWRDDAGARECWHLYHLIGDVMRSDDLASRPTRDAAFLEGLRARLAAEPAPLAPEPLHSMPPLARRLGWRAPAAVAAGFVAVAATVVLLRPQGPGFEGGDALAGAPAAGLGVHVVANPHPSANGALVADGSVIRNARLDAYLQAHQAARGNSPAALPGGGLRSVELLVTPMAPRANASAPRSASGPR